MWDVLAFSPSRFCYMCRYASSSLRFRDIKVSSKIRVVLSETLSQTPKIWLRNFDRSHQARYKQATSAGLLLTTPVDDGGRGQVL